MNQGERIRSLRKKLNATLQQVADATDSSKSYIWELENGHNNINASAHKLSAIACFLGTSSEYLLNGEEGVDDLLNEEMMAYFNKITISDRKRLIAIARSWVIN